MTAATLKIGTWNLKRLEAKKNDLILEILSDMDADIWVLTETSSLLQPHGYQCIQSIPLPAHYDQIQYAAGENRVSIYSKYPITIIHETFDAFTTVCADIQTPFGLLTVYGSVIGVFGNRQPRFDEDMSGHIADFDRIFPGKSACVAGDLNCTFSGRPWPGLKARQRLQQAFENHQLVNTTEDIDNNVDHILLSRQFMEGKSQQLHTWNQDLKLSDHVGHLLVLTESR